MSALGQLEIFASRPAVINRFLPLRPHPIWELRRDSPRLQALLAKYEN